MELASKAQSGEEVMLKRGWNNLSRMQYGK